MERESDQLTGCFLYLGWVGLFLAMVVMIETESFWGFALTLASWLVVVYVIFRILSLWNRNRQKGKRFCPHGIEDGKILGLCEQCREEKQREEEMRKQRIGKLKIRSEAYILQQKEKERLKMIRLKYQDNLFKISPQEFEDIVIELFRRLGYEVYPTPYSGDKGKDAIAFKSGVKYLIECKRYGKNRKVGRPELQKFFGAINEEKANGGFFVTTGQFTQIAIEYARRYGIKLIGLNELIELIQKVFPSAPDDDIVRVMCLECGDIVIFSLSKKETKKFCRNGHEVQNNLSEFISTFSF